MTNIVEITIHLGGRYLSHHQQVFGEIVSEGRTDKNEEYIVFKDAESEEPHKILKRKITKVIHAQPSTTELPRD
jgi:hypothetical protein